MKETEEGVLEEGGSDDQPVILAIDSGTSSCKVLGVAADGRIISETSAPHALIQPRPGWAEQSAEGWWAATVKAVRAIDPRVRRRVVCVTVTSQREGLVPVSGSGEPLANCIIWMDRRAESELPVIEQQISDAHLFLLTGLRLDATFSLPKLLWLRRNEPELVKRAARLLQPADFLLARLTGTFFSDLSLASRTALLDIKNRQWAQRLLDAFEINGRLLPDLVEPGQEIGPVRPSVASELGLARNVTVVAGAGDQQAMAVGTGAFEPHTAAISMGTSTSVVALTSQPILDPAMRLLCSCSALAGGWDLQAPIWTTGALIEWLKYFSSQDETKLLTSALQVNPGADGIIALPHFMGAGAPHWRPEARGAVLGLSLGHGPAHVARALLEAIAYELRHNLEVLRELTLPVQHVTLTGGLTRHRALLALFASILGMPIRTIEVSSAAALGVYANAAIQLGFAGSLTEALAASHKSSRNIDPDPVLAASYALRYACHLEQNFQVLNAVSPARAEDARSKSAHVKACL